MREAGQTEREGGRDRKWEEIETEGKGKEEDAKGEETRIWSACKWARKCDGSVQGCEGKQECKERRKGGWQGVGEGRWEGESEEGKDKEGTEGNESMRRGITERKGEDI